MKNILFLFAVLLLVACANEEKPAPVTKASISGEITNPKGEQVRLSNGDDKFEATLTEGKFTLEIDIDEPGFYNFGHGSETSSMYIEPGDEISLTLDPNEFDESLSYSGKGSEENNYLAARYLLKEKEMDGFADMTKSDEATFIAKMDSIKTKMNDHFQNYVAEHTNMNGQFIDTEQTNLLYEWANNRDNYERYHRYYAKDKDFEVSEQYNDYLKELDLDKGDLLSSKAYKNFIGSYYDSKARVAMKADEALEGDKKMGWLKAQMATFDETVSNKQLKEFLTYSALKDHISFTGIEGVEPLLANFKETTTDKKQSDELQEMYDKWAVLAKGNVAPGFAYDDIEGKQVALENFKGKNVYIDVWATWCGPCKKEIPHLEELQEEYKGNENIVFASVSIDEDKAAWEKMVKEKEMMGVQLIGDKAWDSSICKDYLIRGIPRFILVDKDGKILDSRAPRPSSDEIKDVLKEISKPVLTSMK